MDHGFIPISELGMSEEGFMINRRELNAALYESYVEMCHSSDADDNLKAHEEITMGFKKDQFSVYGQRGMFKWFALSAKYLPDVHKMTPQKEEHNKFYSVLQSEGGYSLGVKLRNAINNCEMFTDVLRSIIVLNPMCLIGDDTREDASMMYSVLLYFFRQKNLDFLDYENKPINKSEIKGKDVILPFGYITEGFLNYFTGLAKDLFIGIFEANTVVAVGLVRFVPSIDGRDGVFGRNDLLPLISRNPMFEIPRIIDTLY